MPHLDLSDLAPECFGALRRINRVGFRQDNGKLLAAVSANDIVTAKVLAKYFGHAAQNGVSCVMTALIVIPLEVVKIEKKQRKGTVLPCCALKLAVERFFHVSAIE